MQETRPGKKKSKSYTNLENHPIIDVKSSFSLVESFKSWKSFSVRSHEVSWGGGLLLLPMGPVAIG